MDHVWHTQKVQTDLGYFNFTRCRQCSDTKGDLDGSETPWPLEEFVAKLCEAADILLDERSYDGNGHELIDAARRNARDFLETKK